MTKYHLRVVREGVGDPRVHALLYFLPPTGHGVRWRSLLEIKINRAPPFSIHTCRAVDIETMKRLHDKVNIFPQTSWQRRLVKVVLIKWFFATFGRLPIALFEVQVNLIPLIGKADSFTKEELQEFKQNVFSSSFPRIFQKGQKIFFPFKFPSDLQPTGKREDLIPQLHHVPQPGWGNEWFSEYF